MADEWVGIGRQWHFFLAQYYNNRAAAARYLVRYGRLPVHTARRLAVTSSPRGFWMYLLAYLVYLPAFTFAVILLVAGELAPAVALFGVSIIAATLPPLRRRTAGYQAALAEWDAMEVLRTIVKHQLMRRRPATAAPGRSLAATFRRDRAVLIAERRGLVRGLRRLRRRLAVDTGPAELGRDTDTVCRLLLWCAQRPEERAQDAARVCAGLLRFLAPDRDPYSGPVEIQLDGVGPAEIAELPDPPATRGLLRGDASHPLIQILVIGVPAASAVVAAVIQGVLGQ